MILCLLLGITLSGCIEEFEADIPAEESNLLVVEGAICSGSNKFILSHTQAIKSYYSTLILGGASVSVRGSDGSEYPTQAADGYYTCWIEELNPNVEYYLHIEADGEVYESEPQKPLRTEKIAEIRGVQNTPDSNIDVLVTPDAPFEPDKINYYSWTYDETWEVHPDYTTNMYFDTEAKIPRINTSQFPVRGWKNGISSTIMVGTSTNYEGQHIQQFKLYDIDQSDERIYYRYSGLVHQRAISKAEYEYEVARRQASSEMGGLFTPQPSSLPTNIHCLTSSRRVIGYVGCALNTGEYRFFFNAEDFSVKYPEYEDKRIWLKQCTEEDCLKMVERGYYLCVWEDYRPTGSLQTAWALGYQLDVRLKGAYTEEPEFWSLKENVSY